MFTTDSDREAGTAGLQALHPRGPSRWFNQNFRQDGQTTGVDMWTEQTVETLKKFANEGKSAAWIAVALGAPSRNAVIGKANRIGIKLNGGMGPTSQKDGLPLAPFGPQIPWGRKRSAPRIENQPRAEMRAGAGIAWGGKVAHVASGVPAIARNKLRADRRAYATAEVGEMRRIGLVDIGKVECRWPIGDPIEEDFAYCGLPIARGHAYCAGHCRLAYRSPSM